MDAEQHFRTIVTDTKLSHQQKVDKLLELGLDFYGLGIGLVSRVDEDVYTVVHANSPGNMIEPGTTFPVGDTYCSHTLKANNSLGVHHAGQSDIAAHPCYANFKLESYIGAPIVSGGKVIGTVNFSAAAPRDAFTPDEFSFIELLAKWLGEESANQPASS